VAAARVTELRRRLADLFRRLGAVHDPMPAAGAVLEAWADAARRYHGLDHLRDCLAELDGAPAGGEDRDRVEAALWFHDVVYDTHVGDNEARSAEWARQALTALGIPSPVADDVARLVLLTRHTEPAADPAGRLLCDVDLSILGRAPDAFDAYDRRIRDEYAWVPEAAYRAKRILMLTRLVQRQPLYLTEHFRTRYEATARVNLARALAALGAGPV
jgi:predicted metal-dependent HD superfamily phosphohydrolase